MEKGGKNKSARKVPRHTITPSEENATGKRRCAPAPACPCLSPENITSSRESESQLGATDRCPQLAPEPNFPGSSRSERQLGATNRCPQLAPEPNFPGSSKPVPCRGTGQGDQASMASSPESAEQKPSITEGSNTACAACKAPTPQGGFAWQVPGNAPRQAQSARDRGGSSYPYHLVQEKGFCICWCRGHICKCPCKWTANQNSNDFWSSQAARQHWPLHKREGFTAVSRASPCRRGISAYPRGRGAHFCATSYDSPEWKLYAHLIKGWAGRIRGKVPFHFDVAWSVSWDEPILESSIPERADHDVDYFRITTPLTALPCPVCKVLSSADGPI